MDAHKLTRFQANHPGKEPPRATPLFPEEARAIRVALARRVAFPPEVDNLALMHHITSLLQPVSIHEPVAEGRANDLDIEQLLRQRGVYPRRELYLNWYRFDRIDRLPLEDVVNYFDDIWYPSADDIELFDASLDWIVAVDHEGAVSFALIPPEARERAQRGPA